MVQRLGISNQGFLVAPEFGQDNGFVGVQRGVLGSQRNRLVVRVESFLIAMEAL